MYINIMYTGEWIGNILLFKTKLINIYKNKPI